MSNRKPFASAVGKFKVSPKESRTKDGRTYDSKLEMRFHEELLKVLPDEAILTQVSFVLQPGFRSMLDGTWQRPVVYKADFVLGGVEEKDGILRPTFGSTVLDAKGMILPSFRTASRLFEYRHGKPVHAVKTLKQLKVIMENHILSQRADAQVLQAIAKGMIFEVKGYKSSDGSVSDITAAVSGRQGYKQLLRASLTRLEERIEESEKGTFPPEEEAVCRFLAEKLRSRLEEKTEEAVKWQSNERLVALDENVLLVEGEPDKLVLLRLEVLMEKVVQPTTKITKKKAETAAREAEESRLPIAAYRHRLNLYPGKYDSLSLLGS